MNSLDHSHRVVLENLAALERAKRCVDEANQYLQDVAREVYTDLSTRYNQFAKWEFNGSRIETRHIANWRESQRHFVTVGLGQIEAAGIVKGASTSDCQAYVYSDLLQDHRNDFPADLAFIRNLPPSVDFCLTPETMTGHVFIKNIGGISAEKFMDRDVLKAFIAAPLTELANWLLDNFAAIEFHLAATPSETPNGVGVTPPEIPSATA